MLRVVADDGRRAALAEVVETAEHAQQLESERVRELARWTTAPATPTTCAGLTDRRHGSCGQRWCAQVS